MTIMDTLNEKRISVYRLSKTSGVPYATVNDICNGKTRLEKCSAETIYRLAQALDVSMEELLTPYMVKRPSFENFKSSVCHQVKEKGDITFIIDTLESRDIRPDTVEEICRIINGVSFSKNAGRRPVGLRSLLLILAVSFESSGHFRLPHP